MDLRRLSHVVALADERHFGRAAERVHLSQPAFSRSIQAAESELRLLLFERGTAEVACTPAGRFFIDRARRLLFSNRCLQRDVDLYRERLLGNIALGAGPYPAVTLVPPLLVELRTRFPRIHSRVEVNNWNYLIEQLRAERLDFIVADANQMRSHTDLSSTPVAVQRGAFFVRAQHPLRGKKGVNPAEMLPFGMASNCLTPCVRAALSDMLGLPASSELALEVECDDLNLIKRVALTTDTVLGCTEVAVAEEVAAGLLFKLDIPGMPLIFADIGVITLKGRSHSPIAQKALEFLILLGAQQSASTLPDER